MPRLGLQRIPFTADADNRLRMLKARTGITPNVLCRIGLCLSLGEHGIPAAPQPDTRAGREINRYTLLGGHDAAFLALLTARLIQDGKGVPEELDVAFLGHVNRGIDMLAARVKSLSDLGELMPTRKAQK